MQAFLKTFLALFGQKGLKALINMLAGSSMFQVFLHDLIMKRLEGVKVKYPTLYTTLDQYATAFSNLPAVLTDEDSNDVDQVAALFALEQHLEGVDKALKTLTDKSKAARIKLG